MHAIMKIKLTRWLSFLWVMVMTVAASAGNMVTVGAKAEMGQVFAGWYLDAERTVPYALGGVDYRTAQMTYAPDETDTLFSRFATEAEDKDSIDFDLSLNPYYNSNAPLAIPLSGAVKSLSLPTLTVANLPTGVKYDAKTLSLTGTPTKPGETKDVKFTIKNLSDKAGKVFTRTFKIGDAQAASLPELHYNDANGYPAFTPGAAVDLANVLGAATMATLAEGGWTITGLPAGMTFDSRTGTFKGAPTTPDKDYLVTFRKGNEMATITMRTGELPKLGLEAVVSENGIPVIDEEVSRQVRVTGAGAYAANKMVSLSATAPKGYVFAGWHDKDLKPVDGVSHDFRVASGYQFKMPDLDTKLIAKFIPISEDRASINDMQFKVSLATGESMQADFIKNAIWSGSFPTVTVRGLPAGITFNATTLLLSGKATDKTSKWYDLVVTAKNVSGYSYTGIFGVSVNGGEPVADVDELGLGSTLDWLDNLKVGGIVEDESSFGTSGDGVTGVTISPAMPEIKIYKESDDGETIFLVDEINGEMPVVKTPGVYTATVNGRVNGKAAKTTKRFIVRDSVSLYERVKIAPGCEGMGTVTGNGKVVHPGEAFAINATPKAGYTFAGWYADPECNSRAWFMPEVADYRQASQSGTVSTDESPGEDVFAYGPTKLNPTVRYARFIQKADDADIRIEVGFAPRLLGDGVYDFADFRDGAEFQVKIFSGTLPTVTFQNLPTWIDKDPVRYFDGLFLWYNEKSEPAPGEYPFTMTAKNLSGATAERKITIRVPNYQNPSLPLEYENGYTLVPGAAFNADEVMPDVDLTGWTVTGLPAGMTFKNGVISGAPTVPDKSYTVWFKKRGEDTATVTMRTKPYPELVLKALVESHDDDDNEIYGPFEGAWYERPYFVTNSAILSKFKVTGSGNYIAGSKVTLGATAPTDYVFVGWRTKDGSQGAYAADDEYTNVKDGDILNPVKNGVDSRSASYTLVMPDADITEIYGVFMPKELDWCTRGGIVPDNPMNNPKWVTDSQLAVTGVVLNVGDDVVKVLGDTYIRDLFYSDSFPTITATGLPAGMKLDAKSLLVSGKITAQPGYFYATFTAKNVSGYTFTRPVKFIVRAADSNVDPVDTVNVDTLTDGNGGMVYTFWLDNLKVGTGVGANIPEGYEYDWLRDDEDEVADYEIYCGEGSSSYGIQSISGLPPGLKVVKETKTSGSYTYYCYSIEGVPTTPGWYTVTINAKDFEGRACKLVKRVPVFDMPDDWIDVEVAEGCETMGTVTGGGLVTAGKTFTITATPKAGYAFAGWYRQAWSSENMSEVLVPVTNMSYNTAWKFYDWRDPSQVWMNDANCPVQFVAKFIPKAEATGETIVSVTSYETWEEMAGGEVHKLAEPVPLEGFNWVIQPASSGYEGDVLDLELSFDAATLPKVTISGLPKGFDATDIGPLWGGQGFLMFDNGVDASSGPEPGDYPVTLTIVNQGVTKKVNFTITIGQYHSWEMDQAGLKTAYSVDVGETSDDWMAALGITGDLTSGREEWGGSWTWSVTGLPKGLSFNKATGKITGKLAAVTADTTSIVHIKKTSTYPGSGTFTEEATTAITVKALPSWLVGTFYGFANVQGVDKNEDGDPNWPDEDDYWEWPNAIEVKVAASGAVTATILDPDSTRITLKTTNVYRTGDSFRFDFTNSLANGEHSTGSVTISRTWMGNDEKAPLGYLHGTETGVDEDEDLFEAEWTAYQDAYTVKPVGVTLPTFAASDSTLTIDVDDVYSTRFGELGTGPLDGELTLRFAPNGAVTPTWRGDTVFTMVAAHMTPITVIDGFTHAKVWVMGYDRVNDEAIGLSINLLIPNTGAPVKASEVNPRFETVILAEDL
jgi:hypothetical protein